MKILDHLQKAIRDAAVHNPEVQVAPACILWPDQDCQWEAAIPVLQLQLPELLVLGDYAPDKRTGPAIWLRCAIAGLLKELELPVDRAPILYLPGVSRQNLRAIESCPDDLKPLAELQYRGVIWSQINAKDWTLLAYLKSDQGGVGLDVAQDGDAKNAMQLAVCRLLEEDISLLKGKRLDKDFFNTLLTGGDPIRDVLHWLDQGDAFRAARGDNEWKAFVEICKSQLAFDPQAEGVLAGSAKLAAREGPWNAVWERYCEAPVRYPNIPAQIRKCKMPAFDLFADEKEAGGWPQWNDEREQALARDLLSLDKVPPHQARKKVLELEAKHGGRRNLIWAELGEAPLVCALEHLATMAELTGSSLAAGSPDDLASGYQSYGWRIDDAVLRALEPLEKKADFDAVVAAIRAVYLPWSEDAARHLQAVWVAKEQVALKHEDCVLFVDGLRFDCAKRLVAALESAGCSVSETPRWSALPSVTGTAKPAVAPLAPGAGKVAEESEGYNFEPMSSYQLRKAIGENGYTLAGKSDLLLADQKVWLEYGDIDHEGHDAGWKLSKRIDPLIFEIKERIESLLEAGFERVQVVTDHGWLLLPGGLPKSDLPSVLSDHKWGRCASLKDGATTEQRLYPWHWNPSLCFALAGGVSCFKKGSEYAHGGLSLQECLTLQLTITRGTSSASAAVTECTDVVWKGLRCTVALEGCFAGLSLDVRTQAGNPESSVVVGLKPIKKNGTASVVVEDEDFEGQKATVVLVDSTGSLAAQFDTVIGGGNT